MTTINSGLHILSNCPRVGLILSPSRQLTKFLKDPGKLNCASNSWEPLKGEWVKRIRFYKHAVTQTWFCTSSINDTHFQLPRLRTGICFGIFHPLSKNLVTKSLSLHPAACSRSKLVNQCTQGKYFWLYIQHSFYFFPLFPPGEASPILETETSRS